MAAKARAKSRDFSRRFWSVLSYACCECCLIVLLYVAAALSYLATRFARICKLRAPCLVCSRLDHVLHGKAWFSGELVCAAHRLEISCLSYCRSHNKLTHSDDLCESCLLSSTAIVGKPSGCAGVYVKEGVHSQPRSRRARLCSCCSEPFKKASNVHRLAELENGRVPGDEMSQKKENNVGMASVPRSADNCFDHLPDGGYRKLNVGSDSEPEVRVSNEDNRDMMHSAAVEVKKEMRSHGADTQPAITTARGLPTPASEDIVQGKSIHAVSSNAAETSASAIGHGLEEISWSQVDASSNLATASMPTAEQRPADLPKEKTFLVGIEEVEDSESVSPGTGEEAIEDDDSANSGTVKPANTATGPARVIMDRNTSLKNGFGGRGNIQSPRLSDIISARDNSRTQEEVKSFLSQMSSTRGFDGPWSDMASSPRIGMQIDESKLSDATSKRPSLERNSSMLEGFDVNLVSEIAGESSVDHLKRQVELDKKSMGILYKELEAERSASAVAASEAMAMINRLQEEKAAMQMEALQYLRMMEEQAEYDQEAIQKLNDLLTEREKELLDVEAELENCRTRLRDEPFEGKFSEFSRLYIASAREVTSEGLNGTDFVKNTMSDFQDEKEYILESLCRLEEMLGISSTNRLASDDVKKKENGWSGVHHAWGNGQHMENSDDSGSREEVESGNGLPLPREHSNGESTSVQSVEESRQETCLSSNLDYDKLVPDSKMSDMTSIRDEILLLGTRCRALEADQKFLEQILCSLTSSNDGVQCVREISSHLREIRRMVIERR